MHSNLQWIFLSLYYMVAPSHGTFVPRSLLQKIEHKVYLLGGGGGDQRGHAIQDRSWQNRTRGTYTAPSVLLSAHCPLVPGPFLTTALSLSLDSCRKVGCCFSTHKYESVCQGYYFLVWNPTEETPHNLMTSLHPLLRQEVMVTSVKQKRRRLNHQWSSPNVHVHVGEEHLRPEVEQQKSTRSSWSTILLSPNIPLSAIFTISHLLII